MKQNRTATDPRSLIAESGVGPHRADHDRSRAGSSGLVAVSRRVREPGSPATPMSDRSTVHATVDGDRRRCARGAGEPGGVDADLDVGAVQVPVGQRVGGAGGGDLLGGGGERASEASRAAMPATPLMRSPASAIRAPMTSIARMRIPTGSRMASSTDSEPRSSLHRGVDRARTVLRAAAHGESGVVKRSLPRTTVTSTVGLKPGSGMTLGTSAVTWIVTVVAVSCSTTE